MPTFKSAEFAVAEAVRAATAKTERLYHEGVDALNRERTGERAARVGAEPGPLPVHSRDYNAGHNEGFKAGVEAALKLIGARHAG